MGNFGLVLGTYNNRQMVGQHVGSRVFFFPFQSNGIENLVNLSNKIAN